MRTEIQNYIIPQQDEYDTVVYGKDKAKKYWNPKTKKYKAWEQRNKTMVWDDIDYMSIVNGKWADYGRLKALLENIDADNIVCMRSKKTHKMVPVASEKQLKEMLGLRDRSWHDFKGKLDKASVLKYVTITDADGSENMRYFINPIYTLKECGISLMCYKLFKESLDKVLPKTACENLQRHWEEEFGGDNATTDQLPEPTNVLDDNLYIPEDPSMDIFARTVLAGKDPQCYDSDNWGMAHNPKSNENVFFLVQESDTGKRTQNDITAYRNVAIDIDFGKDSDGEYIKDVDVIDERKMVVWNELRRVLPTPTAVVDSRNGFHMYWSIQKTEIREEWDCLATFVKDVLAGIIDPTVTCDSARVLRMPGSIHRKEGLMAYDVELLETNDIIYDTAELTSAFAAAVDGIAAAKESILAQIPDMITKKSKPTIIEGNRSAEDVSARVEAIRSLSTDTFTVPETPIEVAYSKHNDYLRHLDLAEFLQLPVGISVECVLHQNKPGHKSATIYAPDDRADNWRYICHCQSKPLDIVGVVMALADCTAGEAYRYLNGVYGIVARKAA